MAKIIVAYDQKGGIGYKNDLPWKPIKEDWAHFKKTTLGGTVIMGRLTWESLPSKPLKDRRNIVISNTVKSLEGAEVYESFEKAIEKNDSDQTFIIGGQSLYYQAINDSSIDEIIATELKETYMCDRAFPLHILKDGTFIEKSRQEYEMFNLVRYKKST